VRSSSEGACEGRAKEGREKRTDEEGKRERKERDLLDGLERVRHAHSYV